MNDIHSNSKDTVELPARTPWPLVVSLGIVLIAAGIAVSLGFLLVGVFVFAFGLGGWIGQLLPGHGHIREPLLPPDLRPIPSQPILGAVEPLKPGAPGYRFRLPERVHPISSGAKGGLVGGLLMSIPALAYGMLAHGSPWFPINLLAGMVFPGLTDVAPENLGQFHLSVFLLASIIHLLFSVTFGLMYGVILPMLPQIKGGWILFGGVLMPILWTGVCYGLMGIVNPLLERHVSWPWFILSQFVYGLAMSFVVHRSEKVAVKQGHP